MSSKRLPIGRTIHTLTVLQPQLALINHPIDELSAIKTIEVTETKDGCSRSQIKHGGHSTTVFNIDPQITDYQSALSMLMEIFSFHHDVEVVYIAAHSL